MTRPTGVAELETERMLALALATAVIGGGGGADGARTAFRLQDHRGQWHGSSDFADKKALVVAFVGVECSLAAAYTERLVELEKIYGPKRVGFVLVDANQQDSLADLTHFAKKFALTMPLLKDVGNAFADQLGAERTPEVFLIDQAGAVAYRGRIDDQYGIGYLRPKPTQRPLVDALDALLAGKPVTVAKTDAEGCYIGKVKPTKPVAKSAVTYSDQVARLLQKRCVECHREGQAAPFALTSYGEVAGWGESLLEMVEQRRMPPWHADPAHGKFSNDSRLSNDEIKTLRDWVESGCPEGDPGKLPPPAQYADGWRIPRPDVVFKIPRPYKVPATGEVRYQYFEVPTNFTEDKWIQAAEALPDAKQVVHHIIVFVRPPGVRNVGGGGGLNDEWLVATAPGARPLILPNGQAKKVPKNSTLVFQMHYTPNGKAATDQSSVGLVFADPKTVKKEVKTDRAVNPRFALKPNKAGQKVEASQRLDENTMLLAMFPHMHLRGQSFRYEARYPDGKREILLDVPRYDFAWQNSYVLAEPKLLPAGTVVHCTATFDNSPGNKSNPNPDATVRWGDQTYEEMMIGYFNKTYADDEVGVTRRSRFEEKLKAGEAIVTPSLREAARKARTGGGAAEALRDELRKAAPQVDHVDVFVSDGGRIQIPVASHGAGQRLMRAIEGAGPQELVNRFRNLGRKYRLLEIAKKGGAEATPNLQAAAEPDLRLFARSFGSGAHAAVTWDGKPAVVNFWSRETDAFPPEAVKLLAEVATLMAEPEGKADRR
jgi:peroxiredoxin